MINVKKLTSNEVASLVSEKAFKFYSDTDPLSIYARKVYGETVYCVCGINYDDQISADFYSTAALNAFLEDYSDVVSE